MKNFILSVFALTLLFSSNAFANADGNALMGKSDCFTCHKLDAKLIGPSFKEIANKYKGQAGAVDLLIKKVLEGGVGTWGQIPMAPHAQLPKEDVKKMIEWILAQAG